MAKWTAFPYDRRRLRWDAAALKKHWARLHRATPSRCPRTPAVLAGLGCSTPANSRRPEAGLKAGGAGITVANKAQASTPTTSRRARRPSWRCSWRWPSAPRRSRPPSPKNANAWYWQAYALGRYSQGISVAKALAQGLGGKVKAALETTIALRPNMPTPTSRWAASTPR
jgi:hypothetical protein